MNTRRISIPFALSVTSLSTAASAQDHAIPRSVIACGGGASVGGSFRVTGAIGQSAAGGILRGAAPSGGVALVSGFWTGSGPAVTPLCTADLNGDGSLDPDDLGDFINCYFAETLAIGMCAAADFNTDGSANADDLADYISAYFAGCP